MKYEQIMDKIEVTPEMRQRVLRNVEAEQANNAGIAISIPAAVVIKAFEIPGIIMVGFAVEPRSITKNDSIIPITVPNNPSKGATALKVPKKLIFFSK